MKVGRSKHAHFSDVVSSDGRLSFLQMYRKLLAVSPSFVGRCSASTGKTKSQPISARSQSIIDRETRYGAANYHPLPVVIERGSGAVILDCVHWSDVHPRVSF